MRWLFFLLLAANLAAFALAQFGDVTGGESHVSRPLRAEQIRLVSPEALPPLQAAAAQAPAACLEWGSFTSTELPRAEAAIERIGLGDRVSSRQLEDNAGYWVYIPPLITQEDAEKKIGELKDLGVSEYFLIQDHPKWKYAISLGIFRSEESAKKFHAGLVDKGVRSAVVGKRDQLVKLSLLVLRDPDNALTERMVELKQEFPGTELRATACGEPGGG